MLAVTESKLRMQDRMTEASSKPSLTRSPHFQLADIIVAMPYTMDTKQVNHVLYDAKKKKAKIYFIFKDSTRGLIFIPEKSGFKDLTTMLKSYPLLINISMRKTIDLCMYLSMVIIKLYNEHCCTFIV